MTARKLIRHVLWMPLLLASIATVHAFEPEGVPAGKPYQVAGVIEWIDLAERELVVRGITYRYDSPVTHDTGTDGFEAEAGENSADTRLRPGMKVGLRVGRGSPRPILEVWVLH